MKNSRRRSPVETPKRGTAAVAPRPAMGPAREIASQPWSFPWWGYALGLLFLAFAAFEAYAPALNGAFVFDDSYLPFQNPNFANLPYKAWLGVRPLLMTTFWFNYQTSGAEPYAYHAVNVILHILNSFLAWLIVRKLLSWAGEAGPARETLAVFSGFLFLLHPVQTESVAYVASRSEALSILFFLSAFAVFLYRKKTAISIPEAVLVLIFFGAACLTKEHTVVLPALLLLTDYFWNPGFSIQGMRRNWKLYVPVFAGAALGGYFVWNVLRQATSAGFGMKEFTWYEYLFTQFRAIWVYLRLYVLPVSLNADYDYPISRTILEHGSIAGLIGLLALCYLAWRYRRDFKLASYGFFGFLLLLAPTSSFVPIRDAIAERRMYLPFICLLLITVDLLRRWRTSRTVLAGALTALLIVAGVLTYQRNHVWAGPIPLWEDTVQKSPENARAHFQLGFAYFQTGRCQEALTQYETAARLETPDDRLLLDWALAYDCLNMPQEAVAKLNQAALLNPSAHIYASIGMVHAKRNNAAEALPPLEKAEQLDPQFDMTYLYRGHVYSGMKDYGKAAAAYRRALSINPSNTYAAKALAAAEATLKNPSP